MTGLLLDTEMWLAAQAGDSSALPQTLLDAIEAAQRAGALFVSAASVLELAQHVTAGRVELGMSVEHYVDAATAEGGLQVLPLTNRILIESARIPLADPLQRLLAATARAHGATLITREKSLLDLGRGGHFTARKP